MKKRFYLPFTLLLAFSARGADVTAGTSAPAAALPTEDDINRLLSLFEAHDKQSSAIRNLHELVSTSTDTVAVDKSVIRSLLTLLELHKKEADLIVTLRASLA